ncbi:MAG: YlbF family regulator [Mogibacterium sp.]|nr:YlbF family regulator [Mogibacterium sp.]
MNVYDEAHSLARAIRESNEFKEFDRIRKEVDKDRECSDMLKELTELQMQLQTAQLTGQQPDKDMFTRFQSLSTMVMTKPLAAQYMQAQMAIATMMNDVFGIVGEAIADK